MPRNTSTMDISPSKHPLPERQTHDYTDELELKSLLIREKNRKVNGITDTSKNKRINELIKTFVNVKQIRAKNKISQKSRLLKKIKERVIKDSEATAADERSRERFGEIILLMIRNILKKRNFSGYTWHDEFYSEAAHNIFKYMYNFDHTKTSKITGQSVNSFSYISQIIHNAIILVITTKSKIKTQTDDLFVEEFEKAGVNIPLQNRSTFDDYKEEQEKIIREQTKQTHKIQIKTTLVDALKELKPTLNLDVVNDIVYPKDYLISTDEAKDLMPLLTGNINILKAKK